MADFFEFSSKNGGIYAFLLRKTTHGQKPGTRSLIDLLDAEDVNRMWGRKFSLWVKSSIGVASYGALGHVSPFRLPTA